MNSEYNNNHFQEEESIDLREIFMKWLQHWHWFLISVLLVGIATAYYLRRTTPEYSVSATILIKDAKNNINYSYISYYIWCFIFFIRKKIAKKKIRLLFV